jgi:hypothetical protein
MSNTSNKTRIPVTSGAKGPAEKKAEVALTKLPARWVGIDRDVMPPDQADNGTGWLGLLIDHSNLRFTGAYLTGPALTSTPPADPIPADAFTGSTTTTKRHWVANIGSLRSQGWGIAFWYVGYSVKGPYISTFIEIPATLVVDTVAMKRLRGALHAKHAKTIIHDINSQCAGSVVFLDNENGEGTATTDIQDYYQGFFEELEKSDSGMPAMRCGLYAHGKVAADFVKDRFDLFVWDPMHDTNENESSVPPFADTAPLTVNPAWTNPDSIKHGDRDIYSFEINKDSPKDSWTAWPLGRQFRNYVGDTPDTDWLAANGNSVPLLKAVKKLDYNSSLVRDPSYPVAEPRIAATADSTATAGTFEGIVVAGTFEARTENATSKTPRMKIASIDGSSGRGDVIGSVQLWVEPDAPLAVAAFTGAPTQYITILTTGGLATFSRDPSGLWSTIDGMPLSFASGLRRPRAIALVAYDVKDLHLFCAGDDYQLYTSRSQSPGEWDVPAVIGDQPALHPFSSLVAASRLLQSVDVFALDDQGLLSTWSWRTPGTWQKVKLDATVPSLLKGTALATVSPDPQKLFVFGVRKDLRLGYWEWTGPAGGWSAHKSPMEWSARLSPHTRLAAHSYPGFVEVVGLSDKGTLRLYSLKSTGTTWNSWSPIDYASPADSAPTGAPPASPLTEHANGWNINPYGDLAITREPSGTVAYAAGVTPGISGVLRLNLSIAGSTWEHLL